MQYGRKVSRFLASRFITRAHPDHSQQCVPKFRYRHVLVSTSLNVDDRAALLLGFELASMHRSTLTLLHVLPCDKQDRNVQGLDAISLLHAAAAELWKTSALCTPSAVAQRGLDEFVEQIVPQELLNEVIWRGECRPGDVAETIVSYANESAADLVILSARQFCSWLPLVPRVVRTIERRARANVIVIRSQAPAFSF